MSKPIVAVVGATGAQGGSVIAALLRTNKYSVRALTRRTDSERAAELTKQGATVVKCDLDYRKDIDGAFTGADYVFAVTNFWDPATLQRGDLDFELKQGKVMADIAKAKKVKHFIWSSLPNTFKESNEKINCHHFTNKALVEEHILKIGLPATFVYPGFYMKNVESHFTPTRQGDGTFQWTTPIRPDVKLPVADPNNDMGPLVVKILERTPAGERVPQYSEELTFPELVKQFASVTGLPASYKYAPITDDMRNTEEDPIKLSSYAMLDWINEYGYYGDLPKQDRWKAIEVPTTPWLAFLRNTSLRLD